MLPSIVSISLFHSNVLGHVVPTCLDMTHGVSGTSRQKRRKDMADAEFPSPTHAAQALASGKVKAGAASSGQRVCLALTGKGWFNLIWSSNATGSYDWIGLFASTSTSNDDYVGGNNWQWATNASPYVTNTPATANYEARYMMWDDKNKKYVAVAKSGGFPEQVCSS
jgi:hypothetical protein